MRSASLTMGALRSAHACMSVRSLPTRVSLPRAVILASKGLSILIAPAKILSATLTGTGRDSPVSSDRSNRRVALEYAPVGWK